MLKIKLYPNQPMTNDAGCEATQEKSLKRLSDLLRVPAACYVSSNQIRREGHYAGRYQRGYVNVLWEKMYSTTHVRYHKERKYSRGYYRQQKKESRLIREQANEVVTFLKEKPLRRMRWFHAQGKYGQR